MKSEEKGCSGVASMRYLITNHHQRRIRLGLGCVTSAKRRVSGSEGGSVEIRCDYPDGYLYKEKYWCRDPCWNKDVLIKTGKTDTVVSVGRFSLYDNTSVRTFTVTMSRLTLQDTGVYYCGLEQWGPDKYTEILLRVTEHTQAMTVSILSTSMPVTVLMDITKTAAMDSSTQSAGGSNATSLVPGDQINQDSKGTGPHLSHCDLGSSAQFSDLPGSHRCTEDLESVLKSHASLI